MVSTLVRQVDPELQGAAFGMFIAVQNAGNGIAATLASSLQPPSCGDSFRCCLLLVASLAAFAAVFTLLPMNCTAARKPATNELVSAVVATGVLDRDHEQITSARAASATTGSTHTANNGTTKARKRNVQRGASRH